jgi:hypothetical protein
VASFLILTVLRPRGPEEEAGDDEKAGGDEEPGASVCGVPAAALDRFDSDDPRERVFREYLRLQQALELTRNHRRPHQTPMEHGRKVSRGDARLGAAFQSLHRVLYRSVYGNLPATEKDAAEFARQCRKIRRVLG